MLGLKKLGFYFQFYKQINPKQKKQTKTPFCITF